MLLYCNDNNCGVGFLKFCKYGTFVSKEYFFFKNLKQI